MQLPKHLLLIQGGPKEVTMPDLGVTKYNLRMNNLPVTVVFITFNRNYPGQTLYYVEFVVEEGRYANRNIYFRGHYDLEDGSAILERQNTYPLPDKFEYERAMEAMVSTLNAVKS